MTKKDYIGLANALGVSFARARSNAEVKGVVLVAEELIDYLKATEPNFDKQKFRGYVRQFYKYMR